MKREVEGWTPERIRKLERAWRAQMRRNMSGEYFDWLLFENDSFPLSFVGYFVAHMREKLNLD